MIEEQEIREYLENGILGDERLLRLNYLQGVKSRQCLIVGNTDQLEEIQREFPKRSKKKNAKITTIKGRTRLDLASYPAPYLEGLIDVAPSSSFSREWVDNLEDLTPLVLGLIDVYGKDKAMLSVDSIRVLYGWASAFSGMMNYRKELVSQERVINISGVSRREGVSFMWHQGDKAKFSFGIEGQMISYHGEHFAGVRDWLTEKAL
jgi:hypothetical protein